MNQIPFDVYTLIAQNVPPWDLLDAWRLVCKQWRAWIDRLPSTFWAKQCHYLHLQYPTKEPKQAVMLYLRGLYMIRDCFQGDSTLGIAIADTVASNYSYDMPLVFQQRWTSNAPITVPRIIQKYKLGDWYTQYAVPTWAIVVRAIVRAVTKLDPTRPLTAQKLLDRMRALYPGLITRLHSRWKDYLCLTKVEMPTLEQVPTVTTERPSKRQRLEPRVLNVRWRFQCPFRVNLSAIATTVPNAMMPAAGYTVRIRNWAANSDIHIHYDGTVNVTTKCNGLSLADMAALQKEIITRLGRYAANK